MTHRRIEQIRSRLDWLMKLSTSLAFACLPFAWFYPHAGLAGFTVFLVAAMLCFIWEP